MPSGNQNNPSGLPVAPDPSTLAAPTQTSVAGGFQPGYKPPLGLQTSSTTFLPGSPMLKMFPGAKGEQITRFGTPYNAEMYTRDDAWQVSQEKVPQLQQMLIAAGLLSDKKVRFGLWDETSAAAYENVLGFANAYGLRATDALRILVDNPQAADTTGRQQRTISFTNPSTVRDQFSQTALGLTGQEQQSPEFVQQYHQMEAAQDRDPTHDYTQAPQIGSAATDYLMAHNRDEIQDYGVASRMNAFYDLLRSG